MLFVSDAHRLSIFLWDISSCRNQQQFVCFHQHVVFHDDITRPNISQPCVHSNTGPEIQAPNSVWSSNPFGFVYDDVLINVPTSEDGKKLVVAPKCYPVG